MGTAKEPRLQVAESGMAEGMLILASHLMMKVAQRYYCRVLPLLLGLSALVAAPPVNDQFANRTRIEGMRLEIAGTFQGATAEAGEPATCCGNASVWWSWTAPKSGLVLVQSEDRPRVSGSIYVTTAASLTSVASPAHYVTSTPIGWLRYATFEAVAGTEYQIGAFGNAASEPGFQFRLCVTNAPIILSGPVAQTISPGENALLTVRIAPGSQIQWQFEGADIPSENSATLTRSDATPNIAGDYRALVSHADSAGNLTVRTSSVARLTVAPPETPRLLLSEDPTDSSVLLISVAGQAGRWYQLTRYDSFFPRQGRWGGTFLSSEFPLRTLSNRSSEYFHLQMIEQSSPTCWLNLQRIYYEKERVAAELRTPPGTPTAPSHIHQILGYIPKCPLGGIYTYGSVGVHATCSIVGHFLYIHYD